jgi:hypothetical protein
MSNGVERGIDVSDGMDVAGGAGVVTEKRAGVLCWFWSLCNLGCSAFKLGCCVNSLFQFLMV